MKRLYRIPEYKFVKTLAPLNSLAAVRLFVDIKLPRTVVDWWRDPKTGDYVFEYTSPR